MGPEHALRGRHPAGTLAPYPLARGGLPGRRTRVEVGGLKRTRARPAEGPRRTSLKEIARITGFSVTTVSMVLNGRAEEFAISGDTRDLVLAAAREHNYQPNLHARSLRSRTTNLVGLMVPTLNNRFFAELVETFETLARTDGKLALFTVTHYDRAEELHAASFFLSQNVDCVFTANPVALGEVSALCARAQTRQVVLDAPESDRPTVTTDNATAALELTRRLLGSMEAEGRTGPVYYVGGMADHEITRLRLAGFRAALRERGLRYSDALFVETRFDEGAAYQAIRTLFRPGARIGGVFLNSLPLLDGLTRFVAEEPELCRPVHYAVFDYHPMMRLLGDLHLWVVKQDAERMMRMAYELLAQRDEAEPILRLVPYEVFSPAVQVAAARPARPGASPGARGR